jgi:hypothetical protein
MLGKRGIIFLALSAIAFILAIVSTPMAIATIETDRTINGVSGHSKVKYTQWQVCVEQSLVRNGIRTETDDCSSNFDCATDMARAARAFSVIAITILALGCCVFGFLDMLMKLPADPVGRGMLIGVAVLAVLSTIISFGVQIGLYTNDCSGTSIKDAEGSKLGAAPILMIIAAAFSIAALVTAIAAPGPIAVVKTVSAGPMPVVNPAGVTEEAQQYPVVEAHNPFAHQPYASA